MNKLYDSKYVHFEWSDELIDKEVLAADNIASLIDKVNTASYPKIQIASAGTNAEYPFLSSNDVCYRFCYYDPLYDIKVAKAKAEQGC